MKYKTIETDILTKYYKKSNELFDSRAVFRIMKILYLRPGSTVEDIIAITDKSPGTISAQLKILYDADVLDFEKEGYYKHLKIKEKVINELLRRNIFDNEEQDFIKLLIVSSTLSNFLINIVIYKFLNRLDSYNDEKLKTIIGVVCQQKISIMKKLQKLNDAGSVKE